MRKVAPKISRDNLDRSIVFKGKKFSTGHGSSDSLIAWSDKNKLYFLSYNHRFSYCGLQIFDTTTDEVNSKSIGPNKFIFFQGQDVYNSLGDNWTGLSPVELRDKILDMMC
jgi:hypothetical protein